MRRDYSGIDVIRFLAALGVAAFHLAYWLWPNGNAERVPMVADVAAPGWVGVELFFVISGFVIALTAAGKSARQFMWRRFLRLYPAVWVCATVTFAISTVPLATYLRSLALFPLPPWVSIVYWTLPLEMAFYAMVALALSLRIRLTALALALGYWSVLYWLLDLVGRASGSDFIPEFFDGSVGSLLLARVGAFFALGILLHARAHAVSAALFLLAGLAEVSVSAVSLNGPLAWLAPLVFFAGLALIVASAFRASAVNGLLHRLPTRTIGLVSYPLYLLHAELGVRIKAQFSDPAVGFSVAIAVLVLLSFVALVPERFIRARLEAVAAARR